MAITTAAFDMHIKLQSTVQLPYKTMIFPYQVVKNCKYNTQSQQRIRLIYSCANNLLLTLSVQRIFWLFSSSQNKNLDDKVIQLVLNLLIFTLTVIALAAHNLLEYHQDDIIYSVSQRCKLVPVEDAFQKASPRSIYSGQLLVHGLTFGVACGVCVVTILPFAVDICPFQLFIRVFIKSEIPWIRYTTKCFASFIYFSQSVCNASFILSFFLLTICLGEGTQAYVSNIYSHPFKLSLQEDNFQRHFGNKVAKYESLSFYACYRKFQNVRIVAQAVNNACASMFGVLVTVGMLTASSAAYCTLKMYGRIPVLMYIACPVLFILVLIVTFVLVYLADGLNRNGRLFVEFWRRFVSGKFERRLLRALPKVGYKIGPFRNARMWVALEITDVIVACTMHVLLIGS